MVGFVYSRGNGGGGSDGGGDADTRGWPVSRDSPPDVVSEPRLPKRRMQFPKTRALTCLRLKFGLNSKIDHALGVSKLAHTNPSSTTLNPRIVHSRVFKPWYLNSDCIALNFMIARSQVF